MSRSLLAALFIAFCSGFTGAALANPAVSSLAEDFQVGGVSYDPTVPTFAAQAGYDIGERPVRFSDMITYLRSIAQQSDRISVETIGYSHERRPILTFTVTSPSNHENLETLRQSHLAQLAGDASPEAAPMVLWINFGVHGAETSGMEAAIPVLYHFAAAQGPAVERQLDDAIMIFTVIFNPDGHARRINHVETFWSYADNTNIDDAAHELWIEARTNHYWFDLNRQWLLLTQPESKAWIRQWHKWKPMVSADYHEMGSDSPYYFHPGEPLRRNALIPERARVLTKQIAERHAAFLDSEARLYSTEEGFDNFYIGKGSTYPQVNGSLGILFEAGAARGGAVETERGLVETRDNVRTQFRTALTTIQGSLDLRDEITAYQRDFFAENVRQPGRNDRAGWVFTADGDSERAARFVRLLRMHDIDVRYLGADLTADGRTYEAQVSYVVPMAQQNNRMIRGIFERSTEFEENIFYDVSGWTLPLAYDLDYASLSNASMQSLRLGAAAEGTFQSAPVPDRAPYGYVLDWSHTYAPRALNRILSADLLARASTEDVSVTTTRGAVRLQRGAVFVPFARQDMPHNEIHALMEKIASEDGVPIHAATSGLTPVTGRDLGGTRTFRALEEPHVVLAYDGGFSRYDVGEVWWTLDYRHRMPVTLVHTDNLKSLDWSNYTHLVFVGGNVELDDPVTEKVQSWIEDGGTLIATRDAAEWAQETLLSRDDEEAEADDSKADGGEESDPDAAPERFDYASMRLRDAEHVIGGSIFAADLDITHPLGFGFSDRNLPVHRNRSFVLDRPEDNPFAVPVQYSDAPLLTGYASARRQKEISGTPSVVVRHLKDGKLILMADNPVFRGTYPGSEKLLMNAIFFSTLIDKADGEYGPTDP